MPKFYGLWNELPECCQQCKNIKPGDINKDIFECSKNLILPTKKKACGKHIKKREPIKDRLARFLGENDSLHLWMANRRLLPWHIKPTPAFFIIENAFIWNYADGGFRLWLELNKKWQEVIRTEYPEYIPK